MVARKLQIKILRQKFCDTQKRREVLRLIASRYTRTASSLPSSKIDNKRGKEKINNKSDVVRLSALSGLGLIRGQTFINDCRQFLQLSKLLPSESFDREKVFADDNSTA